MAEMRLLVAGAGGRIGRTLVKAVADSKAVTLAGALEQEGSPFIGCDAGELAGVGANGVAIGSDPATLAKADALLDFTIPKASVQFAAQAAKSGIVHVIGTTGLSPADEAAIKSAAAKAII